MFRVAPPACLTPQLPISAGGGGGVLNTLKNGEAWPMWGHLRALGAYEFVEVSHARTAYLQRVRMLQLCSSCCARGCNW